MESQANEHSQMGGSLPEPSSVHDAYYHNFGAALDYQARGFHIDAVRCAEPGERLTAAERPRSGLIEASQHLGWRYEFDLTLDPVSNLIIVELRDPRAAALARVFCDKTGLMYGPLGEDPSHYGYAGMRPVPPQVVMDPTNPEHTLLIVHGTGARVPLPSSPPPTGSWLVYRLHDLPARVHPYGFTKMLGVVCAASVLVQAYAGHGHGADFAKALTNYLRARKWTRTSARLFVATIAEVAGDRDVAQMAYAGHFARKPRMDTDQVFDVLAGSAHAQLWSRVSDGLSDDPGLMQQRYQVDPWSTSAFVDRVEAMECHERYHHGSPGVLDHITC
jgi:hypothetical protein